MNREWNIPTCKQEKMIALKAKAVFWSQPKKED
jgi:hypothetical protein